MSKGIISNHSCIHKNKNKNIMWRNKDSIAGEEGTWKIKSNIRKGKKNALLKPVNDEPASEDPKAEDSSRLHGQYSLVLH